MTRDQFNCLYKVHLKASKNVHVQNVVKNFTYGVCGLSHNVLGEKNELLQEIYRENVHVTKQGYHVCQFQYSLLSFLKMPRFE